MLAAVVAFASLRPITALDEGVELLFLPARAALELGADGRLGRHVEVCHLPTA